MTQIIQGNLFPRQNITGSEISTPLNRVELVDMSKVDPKLLKAAQGIEAMFMNYMLETMRKSVPKNDFDLESPATEVYRSQLNWEVSQQASKNRGIGLAEQIVAYMVSSGYTGKGRPKPSRTGGTNEDQ